MAAAGGNRGAGATNALGRRGGNGSAGTDGSTGTLAGCTLAAGALELDAAGSLAFLDGLLEVGTVHGSPG